MQTRTIHLAQQVLDTVSKSEVNDLIKILKYYNQFDEKDRAKGMRYGSTEPEDRSFEKTIKEGIEKTAGSQDVYMVTTQNYCRMCGKPI